jgi:hypothetical protein
MGSGLLLGSTFLPSIKQTCSANDECHDSKITNDNPVAFKTQQNRIIGYIRWPLLRRANVCLRANNLGPMCLQMGIADERVTKCQQSDQNQ